MNPNRFGFFIFKTLETKGGFGLNTSSRQRGFVLNPPFEPKGVGFDPLGFGFKPPFYLYLFLFLFFFLFCCLQPLKPKGELV